MKIKYYFIEFLTKRKGRGSFKNMNFNLKPS